MSLENALYDRLKADATLTSLLAQWTPNGGTPGPAIWVGAAPPDTAPGWSGGVQYPRIVFVVDRAPTASQILQGTIHVQIWAQDLPSQPTRLSDIRERVEADLNDAALYAPDEGMVALQQPTQMRLMPREPAGTRVTGVDQQYRFLGAPAQNTYPPDPVATLNRFVSQYLDPSIAVNPGAWVPTDATPALYWRVSKRRTAMQDKWFTGWWVNAEIRGHVWAPSAYARHNWAQLVVDSLNLPKNRSIRMDDAQGTPLIVHETDEDYDANPFSLGQILVRARYGVLADYAVTVFQRPPIQPPPSGGSYVPPDQVVDQPGSGGYVTVPEPVYVSTVDTGTTIDHIHLADRDQNQDPLAIDIGIVIGGAAPVGVGTAALTTT